MKIVIVTDAWEPQVNGVVRTLNQTRNHLEQMGHEVQMVTPESFKTFPLPSYPSIRVAILPGRKVRRILRETNANAIHIATEGPLGSAARKWCLKNKVDFTTSYHTQFPEYIRLRFPIPLKWSYAWFRNFHNKAVRTLVPTESQRQRLLERGFNRVVVWGRGVDTSIFTPNEPKKLDLPRPIMMNMGRVAVEKNIEAFLDIDLPGSKIVVGDGPDLDDLKQKYPDVTFTGAKFGKELAAYLAASDVFVFPSKTDTFGLVILEAMACGLPVAAYPVTGPSDIIIEGKTGSCQENLNDAVKSSINLSRDDCLNYANEHSWAACTKVFESYMHDNKLHHNDSDKAITNPTFWCL